MNGFPIQKATLGRLPQYLEYLKTKPKEQHTTISATTIAKALSLGEIQVRKDLAQVSGAGKPKIGYVMQELITDIERALGHGHDTDAVLVGAGQLGQALLRHDGFREYGVNIVAAFDHSEARICPSASLPILSMKSFRIIARRMRFDSALSRLGRHLPKRFAIR
jgi:redox-sensing transcriptional repressor